MFKAARRKRRDRAALLETVRIRQQIFSSQLVALALNSEQTGVGNDTPHDIVVSLTTFEKRIDNVCLTIESLMQQSLRPDRIVLAVTPHDLSHGRLPAILQRQKTRGLQILMCEQDLGPYGKFFHTMQLYPDSLVITVDDDMMYPFDHIDILYHAWLQQPAHVTAHRAHRMLVENGSLRPYSSWQKSTEDTSASPLIFPTGVGGVLYFPGSLNPEVFNKDEFMRLCPRSDDIWLKAMSLMNGTMCRTCADPRETATRLLVIPDSQKFALKRANKSSAADGNDSKLKAVFDHYQLWSKLFETLSP